MNSPILFETTTFEDFQKDCKVGETYLETINDYMSFNRWTDISRKIGESSAQLNTMFKWWLGDFINFGEQKFGDQIFQVTDGLGLEYSTINKILWVTKSIPREYRRPELSFSHHEIVAAIKDKRLVDMLLRKGAEGKMSLIEFRSFVRVQFDPQKIGINKNIKPFYQNLTHSLDRSAALLKASELSDITPKQLESVYERLKPILDLASEIAKDVQAARIG